MRAGQLAPVGVFVGHVTVAVAAATLSVGRGGIGLVAPAVRAPARVATQVSRGARGLWDTELSGELASLLDPRPGRSRRRVADHVDRVHAEVRGLTGPDGARLGAVLEKRLAGVAGLPWWQVNAVTGRVSVGLDTGQRTVADVLEIIRAAEAECGTREVPWNRHVDLPGDREPLIAAGLAMVADLVGAAAAIASRALPAPAAGPLLAAAVALVDAQPRLRRMVEAQLGAARTDLAITAGNAAAQAMSHDGATLLVDAGQRFASLVELLAARASWQRWDRALHGPGGIAIADPLHSDERPQPLPLGPIERFADQAAAGSLMAAAASLMGHQNVAATAEVLLVGVPKATRTSRASFASVLSASMSRQGALCLDSSVWRRLDRVSALVVDGAALRTGRPLVLDAQLLDDAWSTAHVWGAGQRLLREDGTGTQDGDRSPLPIPPPRGRGRDRLQLDEHHPGPHDPDGVPRGGPAAQWRDLSDDGRVVGRVLVGRELHPRADGLLATARRSGLRVVLAGEAPGSELRGRADELIPPGRSLTRTVRGLQQTGHVVAVLSIHGHRALAAADVGLGVSVRTHSGRLHIPWSADVICEDLAGLEQIVAATARARAVSERGRTMAMAASALGALLRIAGPRPGAWHRAISPITGAALIGLITGARTGWLAGRPLGGSSVPLVPWHCLEADEVLSRLPVPPERTEHGPGRAARAGDALRVPLRSATSMFSYVRHELDDPLTPVLTVGAGASAILGAPTDAALVACVMGVNALVSASQRRRADGAMRTMRRNERVLARCLTGPRARAIDAVPDGRAAALEDLVPAEALRPGDVVALGPGDVVPADARLLHTDGLEVDESGLTGESVTVEKRVGATPGAALGERACMVFEGSIVVTGRARAVVVAVGPETQAGRAVAAIPRGSGSGGVQAQLRALTDKALPLTLAGGALVTGLGMLRGQRMRAAVADGVAVAVAAVPEGLPLVATVAQLAAARRLSRRGVLVRSSRTIEALGRVDTMCFDKTGTLTHGVLRLVELADLTGSWTPGQAAHSRDARRLLRAAARACPDPADGPVVHATDRAVLDAAGEHHLENTHVWDPHGGGPVREQPGIRGRPGPRPPGAAVGREGRARSPAPPLRAGPAGRGRRQ